MSCAWPALAEWKIDLSRRAGQMGDRVYVGPASTGQRNQDSFLDAIFHQVTPSEEIVILNTENGFVPSTIRLRSGIHYRFTVVNVNEKAKNVSFVLDSFSEHHATFYGELKSFFVLPKKEGVFTFVSPETSAQGRLVVQSLTAPGTAPAPALDPVNVRTPASTGN
jgi:hypothetical protein